MGQLKSKLLTFLLIITVFFSNIHNSWAINDYIRGHSIGSGGTSCNVNSLQFNPFEPNPDILWELTNPTCIAYVAASGAAIKTAGMLAAFMCERADGATVVQSLIGAGIPLSPTMFGEEAKDTTSCASQTVACAFSGGSDCATAGVCCAATLTYAAAIGVAVGALAIIYGLANDAEQNTHICGQDWNAWYTRPIAQITTTDATGISGYTGGGNMSILMGNNPKVADPSGISYPNSYQQQLTDSYTTGAMQAAITASGNPAIQYQQYREYIYGGREYEDNGNGACPNPSWSDADMTKVLGYTLSQHHNQVYYMRGPKLSANYACNRFLLSPASGESLTEKQSATAAYNCCIQRSQNTICLEHNSSALVPSGGWTFCKVGSNCNLAEITYQAYQSTTVPNYVCAQTYSVCPYNHLVGGGTEIAQYNYAGAGAPTVLTDDCEYLKNCVRVPAQPFIAMSNLKGAWISSACYDLAGDSQNNYGYTADLIPVNTRHFSAPIVQCFKETIQNMFTNTAGTPQCKDSSETYEQNGCASSGVSYSEGQVLANQQSFFVTIQNYLQTGIKITMTLAITIMGIGILLAGSRIEKKSLMMFIIKLCLVSYFALGDAWQTYFYSGVNSASMVLSEIFLQLDENKTSSNPSVPASALLDGCQFPKYNYSNPSDKTLTPAYPPGKEYLQIWDSLDCKIAMSLGFGPSVSVPNVVMMILAGFLTNGLGIIYLIATFIFAFYLIALTVRAVHIFLMSTIAITLLIYVSPITITCCLFKKTEKIFKEWREYLLGYVLQPVILFAYLGILITIFDATLLGSATFKGDGISAPKTIDCSAQDSLNPTINVPNNDSIYCIFFNSDITTNNTLSALGIGLPQLAIDFNQAKLRTIMQSAFIMFILTKFLDQITLLAEKLVGGSELKSQSGGALASAGKAFGIAKGIEKRGMGAIRKHGGGLARRVGGAVKSFANDAGKKRNGGGGSGGAKTGVNDSSSDPPK